MRRRYGAWITILLSCATGQEPPKASPAAPAPVVQAEPPAPEVPPTVAALAVGAQLYDNLGSHHRSVGTQVPDAQAFFDQGLRLAYGFNHDEATRSFARAAQLDPRCGACFWGVAWTLGPNYNVPMLPERTQAAWDALQAARRLAPSAQPVERELITALSRRYRGPTPLEAADQHSYDQAFAASMKEVAGAHPNDDDVQVIYAESLMDVNPWKLWTLEGKAAPGTAEAVAILEKVLARSPNHPGANHYYIHVVEASNTPQRALAAADRLPGLMPGAGHLVHMPAHIYQRVGRYEAASEANRQAVKADEAYFKRTKPPGYYPMYLGHNFGFLAYSAAMEGRSKESLAAARDAVKAIPPEMLEMMPGMDFFAAEQFLVMVRFGMWGAILEEPRPPEKYQTLTALWLHARGMALASTGQLDQARAVAQTLRSLATTMPADLPAGSGLNQARTVAALGLQAIEARLAERTGQKAEAIAGWKRAVALEDGMAYNEPADWFYPMRHYLGASLLDARRAKDAEQVFRADLKRNPGNGWALYGLYRAMAVQKSKAAPKAKADYEAAWAKADTPLRRAAF